MNQKLDVSLSINGETIETTVPVRMNLVDFIRNEAGLTGSHIGCEHGVCGACTVEVNGSMVRGCLMLAVQANGASITTIEGFSNHPTAARLQQAFQSNNALQCGFCTPGMMATAVEYIDGGGGPDRAEIREHISGNYCRCTGYQSIVDAVCDVIDGRAGA